MKEVFKLKKKRDIEEVFKYGKKFYSPFLNIYVFPNAFNEDRIGFSVTSELKKAVKRNRARRRLKEALRLSLEEEKLKEGKGKDLVLMAKKEIIDADFSQIKKSVKELIALAKRC